MAGTDIFGNNSTSYPKIKGGIKFNGQAVMAFQNSGAAYEGMVVQNYNIDYQQNVTKLRGLNTDSVLAVVAPPNGTFSMQVGLTSADGYLDFLAKYGDACETVNNSLQIMAKGAETCGNQKGGNLPSLTMQGCLASRVTLSQQIDNLVLMSQSTIEFVALDKN